MPDGSVWHPAPLAPTAVDGPRTVRACNKDDGRDMEKGTPKMCQRSMGALAEATLHALAALSGIRCQRPRDALIEEVTTTTCSSTEVPASTARAKTCAMYRGCQRNNVPLPRLHFPPQPNARHLLFGTINMSVNSRMSPRMLKSRSRIMQSPAEQATCPDASYINRISATSCSVNSLTM